MKRRDTILFSLAIIVLLSGYMTFNVNGQATGAGKKEEASIAGGGFQFKMIVKRNNLVANNKSDSKIAASKSKQSVKNSKTSSKIVSKKGKSPNPEAVEKENIEVGKVLNLPKPGYPKAASAVGASGAVEVQVTIDEAGNVVEATAISGHQLLRAAAVEAAKQAKFTPTLLNKEPVMVTGVVVYNFTK